MFSNYPPGFNPSSQKNQKNPTMAETANPPQQIRRQCAWQRKTLSLFSSCEKREERSQNCREARGNRARGRQEEEERPFSLLLDDYKQHGTLLNSLSTTTSIDDDIVRQRSEEEDAVVVDHRNEELVQ